MNNKVTGVLSVHSVPRALCSHIEWAVNTLVGSPLSFRWKTQQLSHECARVEVYWDAVAGTAARLASNLAGWRDIRFEVTEDPSRTSVGRRYSYTPDLGLFGADIDELGNTLITDVRISAILTQAGSDISAIRSGFDRATGAPWDRELEAFRASVNDDSVRLLRGVG